MGGGQWENCPWRPRHRRQWVPTWGVEVFPQAMRAVWRVEINDAPSSAAMPTTCGASASTAPGSAGRPPATPLERPESKKLPGRPSPLASSPKTPDVAGKFQNCPLFGLTASTWRWTPTPSAYSSATAAGHRRGLFQSAPIAKSSRASAGAWANPSKTPARVSHYPRCHYGHPRIASPTRFGTRALNEKFVQSSTFVLRRTATPLSGAPGYRWSPPILGSRPLRTPDI